MRPALAGQLDLPQAGVDRPGARPRAPGRCRRSAAPPAAAPARCAASDSAAPRPAARPRAADSCARRLVEGAPRPGLDAEFAVRAPFGDVEVDFQHAPLRQHQVDPERQRKFQRLADEAAARPQEQVLGGLLGDGRAAAHLARDRRPPRSPPAVPASRCRDGCRTARPPTRSRCAAGPARSARAARKCASTRSPVTQRPSIRVETGSTTR